MIFPSLLGPDNLPPLEAMVHGIPNIAISELSGTRDLHGEAFEYFDPMDLDSLVSVIRRLLTQTFPKKGQPWDHASLQNSLTVQDYCKELSNILNNLRVQQLLERGGF
jgi:hypothetical protein